MEYMKEFEKLLERASNEYTHANYALLLKRMGVYVTERLYQDSL